MFKTIFNFEFKYWLTNPMPYIFGAILFGIPFITMWGMTAEANIGENIVMRNSEVKIHKMAAMFILLFILILPAIIGTSIFKDYKSRMYTLLYSYPFKKRDYLLGKFLSAFLAITLISIAICLGFALGTIMPGVKQEVLLPFTASTYLKQLFIYIIPNTLIVSSIIFAVVIRTRNIYIGFISVIVLILFKAMIVGLLSSSGLQNIGAILDPLGGTTVDVITSLWTLEEKNYNSIPFWGLIFWNRLFWIIASLLTLFSTYKRFEFNQFATVSTKDKNQKEDINKPNLLNQIQDINIPEVHISHSIRQQLNTSWHLSNVDFKSIIFSWSFLVILSMGLMVVLFQQYQMGTEDGIVVVPTTANMLRVPMFIFSGIINFLTFLYSGILMYKSRMVRMDSLIDICPQPNWVLLLSKVLAIFKMQVVLLGLVMIAGIFAQILNGYYRFEIGHYIFELFVLQGIHFVIWTCLAICVHSISKNMYVGFFFLLIVPMALLFVDPIANFLNLPILSEEILKYNAVKGQFLGFDYSDYNGYGAQLTSYFVYKFYWLIAGIGLILVALTFWKRGLSFTIKERIQLAKQRFSGKLKYSFILGFISFILMGFSIYHQEYHVSKVVFTESFENEIMARNEKLFGHLENIEQPILKDVKLEMDFYPKTQDYKLSGQLQFINLADQLIDTIVIAKSFKDETIIDIPQPHQAIQKDDSLHYEVIKLNTALSKGDTFSFHFKMENYSNSILHHNSRVIENGNYILGNILPQLRIRNIFIRNKKKRAEYKLEERNFKEATPSDSTLLNYNYAENNMGLINYECILSTSQNQQAFTMGELINKWTENGRNYYHHKSKGPIVSTISWMCGSYIKNVSQADSIALEMYRHPKHDSNDEHMFNGTSASLSYCSKLFGKLNYDTIKMVEFPVTFGTYATVNGNLIPFSETYLQCDVHDHNNDIFNMPYFVAAHETAHHWWGHRVDPANVKGSRIITEGMADYLSFKIIEEAYDYEAAFKIRKKMFNSYLEERAYLANETPLVYSSLDNKYLNYRKASMALYALNNYLGDSIFNKVVTKFEKENRYAEPPFPTSLDFVEAFKNDCPDSLQYLISDYYESIILYDNSVESVSTKKVSAKNDTDYIYNTIVNCNISKYRSDKKGKRSYDDNFLAFRDIKSLPLKDYIDITLFGESNNVLKTKRVLINQIQNILEFETSEDVHKVKIDKSLLLIDANQDDNVWTKK